MARGCSSAGFGSQHPQGDAEGSVTPVAGGLMSALFWPLVWHIHAAQTYMRATPSQLEAQFYERKG